MPEELASVDKNQLDTPSILQEDNTENQLLDEYKHKIYPKIRGLCQIFTYLKKPPLTIGTYITFRIPSMNQTSLSYYIAVLPHRQPYLLIKPTDFLIYNSKQYDLLSKPLLTHKLIYDLNPDVNFIIHSHDKYVDAVSSMKCGLLKISTQSVVLKNIAYLDRSMYVPTVDGNCLEVIGNELSAKIKDSRILFLRCNGALCYGSTVEEAFHYIIQLETASKIQILAKNIGDASGENLYTCDPEYCDFLINETLNNEFFRCEYATFLFESRHYMNLEFRQSSTHYDKYDNSYLNTSSLDEIPFSNYRFDALSCNTENTPKRPNSSHESKVNIPKCESIRENVLSYEFRSNITSTASNYDKSTDDQEELPVLRRAKRFKAKRCCSLTSGVEKAIAKKVFGSTTPCDERPLQ